MVKRAPEPIPVSYVCSQVGTSPKFAKAFAQGCGGALRTFNTLSTHHPAALFVSLQAWRAFRTFATESVYSFYYADYGYFHRVRHLRVTRNAFQHDGVSGLASMNRFFNLGIPLKPWRRSGNHIIVCPPDDGFAKLHGFREASWLDKVVGDLRQSTDRKILIRNRVGAERNPRPLSADLRGAWALVTYTSNAAVDAIVAGIPVITTGRCAATSMGLMDPKQIEDVRTDGDREPWAARLAGNQWTLDEIKAGACWRYLKGGADGL